MWYAQKSLTGVPEANISPQGSGVIPMKTFTQILLRVSDRYGMHRLFPDFLEMIVCALSAGRKEDRYLEIVKNYQPSEVVQLSEAFASLVMEMDDHGSGMKDSLGDFFMDHVSHGNNGQYFTPQPLCDMMAMITNPVGSGLNIADCACGSGRTLMAAAKVSRFNQFYGADIDRTCCMMAVINLCLNGMIGEVAWMDSLSNHFYGAWKIECHPEHPIPCIREITEDESYIVLRITESKTIEIPQVVPCKEEAQQTDLWNLFKF